MSENIVITGDSAGGHLAIAVTILAIVHGIQVPKGVLAHYPVLSSDARIFQIQYLNLDIYKLHLQI